MTNARPTPDAVDAARSLNLALTELHRAADESEFVANRAGVAEITLTLTVPGSIPVNYNLTAAEREAALVLLPSLSRARIAAAREKVRALTDRVNSGSVGT